ncbi:MAG TPA: NADH-quinone oxidoreductase subunit J [Planctomycetota bacterium]|nr:NADH-quinone oxidoreductase subunit J [Planctomycetota bacterium]
MPPIDPVFLIAAGVTVGAGALVVSLRNPVHAAISMLAAFLGLAVIYLRLGAPFLAAIHVLVYTGAILVLFLFVIMMLNLKPDELGVEYPLKIRIGIAALCGGLFALIALPLLQDHRELPKQAPPGFGTVESVGTALFNEYALAFELISVLIMVAVFAGVLLAKRKL